MAEAESFPASAQTGGEKSLKDKGNDFFKAGLYLKAAALYTQAIKQDSSNATLYSNRAAAFLHLFKLNKALVDAETTIKLNPQWDKGYFRKGCVLEAMGHYDDALSAIQIASELNPQSMEMSKKIKKLTQLAEDKKRSKEVDNKRSNVDMAEQLSSLTSELSEKCRNEECYKEYFSFIVETMETAIKSWHESSKVDARIYFLLDKKKSDTEKFAQVINVDKAFESPDTHGSCISFLRGHAQDSFSKAACLVVPKTIISYPQVWKGEGSRKWRHGMNDGFFIQFESPFLQKLWFVPTLIEQAKTFCSNPEVLDISAHEVIPRLFKAVSSYSGIV